MRVCALAQADPLANLKNAATPPDPGTSERTGRSLRCLQHNLMRCAVCAAAYVGPAGGGVGAPAAQCNACSRFLCDNCAVGIARPYRCKYCHSIAPSGGVNICTKSFRVLGMTCMGQRIEFVEEAEDGSVCWSAGTLLVRSAPSPTCPTTLPPATHTHAHLGPCSPGPRIAVLAQCAQGVPERGTVVIDPTLVPGREVRGPVMVNDLDLIKAVRSLEAAAPAPVEPPASALAAKRAQAKSSKARRRVTGSVNTYNVERLLARQTYNGTEWYAPPPRLLRGLLLPLSLIHI